MYYAIALALVLAIPLGAVAYAWRTVQVVGSRRLALERSFHRY